MEGTASSVPKLFDKGIDEVMPSKCWLFLLRRFFGGFVFERGLGGCETRHPAVRDPA